jgi:transcriptional regulator with XRE-family HTH domain
MTDYTIVTKVHIFSYLFRKTMDHYKITGKQLSEVSGISENHISDFRRGKRKTGVSTKVLWQLIEAMETIAPGARTYFASLLAEADQTSDLELVEPNSAKVLEPAQLAMMMNSNIDLVTKAIQYLPSTGKAEIVSAIAQSIRLTGLKEA